MPAGQTATARRAGWQSCVRLTNDIPQRYGVSGDAGWLAGLRKFAPLKRYLSPRVVLALNVSGLHLPSRIAPRVPERRRLPWFRSQIIHSECLPFTPRRGPMAFSGWTALVRLFVQSWSEGGPSL